MIEGPPKDCLVQLGPEPQQYWLPILAPSDVSPYAFLLWPACKACFHYLAVSDRNLTAKMRAKLNCIIMSIRCGHTGTPISSGFWNCLSNVHNKMNADIDLERDHHLLVAYLHLRLLSATTRMETELLPSKFNTGSNHSPAILLRIFMNTGPLSKVPLPLALVGRQAVTKPSQLGSTIIVNKYQKHTLAYAVGIEIPSLYYCRKSELAMISLSNTASQKSLQTALWGTLKIGFSFK